LVVLAEALINWKTVERKMPWELVMDIDVIKLLVVTDPPGGRIHNN
jgi:hypothetical protein